MSVLVMYRLFLSLILFFSYTAASYGATASGYSEYFIPGDETHMYIIFNALDPSGSSDMHSVITVTAWSDNTIVYYDHWEYGFEFDPANPDADLTSNGGHVEKHVLLKAGDVRTFESSDIPTNPRGTNTYYDGGDRVYVAGGAVTVTRASWIEARGVGNQADAWEIYPVQPQLTTHVMPFGEDLPFVDFNRVFALVQATEDNTIVQLDFNGDGVYDMFCTDLTRTTCNAGPQITLAKGQSFLLDNWTLSPQSSPYNQVHSGTVIKGSATIQVKYSAGDVNWQYMARGFSSFPRGFWTKDYYAPLSEPANARITDYYLYNPNSGSITINWESRTGSGSFNVGANSIVSFRSAAGVPVPTDSGLYFKGSDIFWGVGVGDSTQDLYEWGFSLLPSTMLYDEHFLGWAPDSNPPSAGTTDNGVFLMAAQDNTRVFVDYGNDGTTDQTYTLDRLQTQYITDPNDGDMSQTHFWATGPFTLAYGQNADTARTPGPLGGMDLGYVGIPSTDFISLVLTVDKSVSPQVVSTASGSEATFTIKVNSRKYTINGVNVTDYLPPKWQYQTGSTTIIWPDRTTHYFDPSESGAPDTPYTIEATFKQSLLMEGDNKVEIQSLLDPGVPYSLVMIDSLDLAYERLYIALDDLLVCRGNSGSRINISGFLSPDISVFDITDPLRPKVVASATIGKTERTYSVSFISSSDDGIYLAASLDAVRSVKEVWAYVPADLSKTNSADYLIITTPELTGASQTLADYRAAQGFKTKIVTLESIFDAFNYGISNPDSIREFLYHAYTYWKKAPRYVVIVGEGTYDYRDIYGFGDNLIPVAMVNTPFGLFPSDNYLADVDGDYMPEMAIGRLPVMTTEELTGAIKKIIAYENSVKGSWRNKVLLAADDPDTEAGDFPLDSNEISSLLPSGYSAENVYLSESSIDVARQTLFDRINTGVFLLNYIGHGSPDRMADEGLLLSSDVGFLTNGDRLPVVSALTCFVNNFGSPGYDSLGELLFMKNNGGASAVWGPTGLSLNSDAVVLGKNLFRAIFQENEQVLGKRSSVRSTNT